MWFRIVAEKKLFQSRLQGRRLKITVEKSDQNVDRRPDKVTSQN